MVHIDLVLFVQDGRMLPTLRTALPIACTSTTNAFGLLVKAIILPPLQNSATGTISLRFIRNSVMMTLIAIIFHNG